MNAPTPTELRQAHQAILAALDAAGFTVVARADADSPPPRMTGDTSTDLKILHAYEAGLADGRAVAWRPRPGPLTVTVDDDEWAQWCDRTGTPRPGPGQRDIFGGEHP